jgi:hypothetical protein
MKKRLITYLLIRHCVLKNKEKGLLISRYKKNVAVKESQSSSIIIIKRSENTFDEKMELKNE